MYWKKVEVLTSTEGIDPLCAALLELDITGVSIRDAADFEAFLQGGQGKWDYLDESLLPLREAESAVTFYLPEGPQGDELLGRVRQSIQRLRALDIGGSWGRLTDTVELVAEESWEHSWKQYYKPTKIGSDLVVCPTWEEYRPSEGEVVIRLDPGMAFGTGTHESTRLCLELLEEIGPAGKHVLDLGCGSGILSVGALLLGARSALGIDLDETAVRVAGENAALNGLQHSASFRQGNLTDGVTGAYDIVFANIVADVILRLIPSLDAILAPNGVLIASGIIDSRAAQVEDALPAAGMAVLARRERGGWVGLLVARN